MKGIHALFSVLLLSACASSAVGDSADVTDLALNPARFNGKQVATSGVMVFNSAGVFLYPSCAGVLNGEYRRLLLLDRDSMKNVKDTSDYWAFAKRYDLKPVRVTGIVSASGALLEPGKQVGGWVKLMDVDMSSITLSNNAKEDQHLCNTMEAR